MHDRATRGADRMIVLREGGVHAEGAPREVLTPATVRASERADRLPRKRANAWFSTWSPSILGPDARRVPAHHAVTPGKAALSMRAALLVVLVGSVAGCCFGGVEGTQAATGSAAPGLPSVAPGLPQPAEPPTEPPPRADVPVQLEGASMSMDSMTVNGQELAGLSCTGEFNLFGGNPAGALADQGAALSACVQGPARPRVHYAFTGGAVSDVRVADAPSPTAARCIANVVAALHPPGTGACVATVVLGAAAQ